MLAPQTRFFSMGFYEVSDGRLEPYTEPRHQPILQELPRIARAIASETLAAHCELATGMVIVVGQTSTPKAWAEVLRLGRKGADDMRMILGVAHTIRYAVDSDMSDYLDAIGPTGRRALGRPSVNTVLDVHRRTRDVRGSFGVMCIGRSADGLTLRLPHMSPQTPCSDWGTHVVRNMIIATAVDTLNRYGLMTNA